MNFFKPIIFRLINKVLQFHESNLRSHIYQKYKFPKSVRFWKLSLEGNIQIGDQTYFNDNCRVDSGENSSVVIGMHCAIGRWVHITSKTHSLDFPTTAEDNPSIQHQEANVRIGNYVWIGDHVYIGPGITIGDYAVIGANSMVNKDVKPFEIVGGVPARHIRFNTEHRHYLR